jgi:tetratricopeptide (TPR) repeat protein
LSNELVEQLKDLIKLYKTNYLVPRFIFENEKTLVRVFGKKGFEALVNDLYRDGRSLLMFKAAMSYLESEYYSVARKLFLRVGRLDDSNRLALFLYLYTSAYYFYFKNRFSKAQHYAEKALKAAEAGDGGEYRVSLERLMQDLSKETKGASKRNEGG